MLRCLLRFEKVFFGEEGAEIYNFRAATRYDISRRRDEGKFD